MTDGILQVCFGCGQTLPIDQFRLLNPDGLAPYRATRCHACEQQVSRLRRSREAETGRAHAAALARLLDNHRAEYDRLCRDELVKRGLG